jgi:hypothetical protein
MRHLLIPAIAIWFLCTACATTGTEHSSTRPAIPTCTVSGSHTVLSSEGEPGNGQSHRLVDWTLEDTPELWRPTLPSSSSLLSFRAAVARLTSVPAEPHDDHARAILEREYQRQLADPSLQREAELTRRQLLDVATDVQPMRCFEAHLFARQADRLDMVTRPTEFLALVFRSADKRRLRVLEYTVDAPGIGRVGRIMEHAEPLLASGEWHFWTALHNHNFFFESDRWYGGSVAPSGPDAQLLAVWRDRFGLAEYWITNGFSTALRKTDTLD